MRIIPIPNSAVRAKDKELFGAEMKRLFFITLFLVSAYGASAQCIPTPTDPCTSVHQSILDRAAHAIDELTEARKVIAAFQNERTATDAERAAYKNLATVTETAIAILQKGIADRDTVIALQQKAMEALSQVVEKLEKQISRPKSGWAKFAGVMEKVVVLLAGVAIGGL